MKKTLAAVTLAAAMLIPTTTATASPHAGMIVPMHTNINTHGTYLSCSWNVFSNSWRAVHPGWWSQSPFPQCKYYGYK